MTNAEDVEQSFYFGILLGQLLKVSVNINNKYLLLISLLDNSIQSIECSRCYKQYVRGIHSYTVPAHLSWVSLWDINHRPFKDLQQTLQTK